MKNMTVKNIAMACGGELVGADAVLDKEIKGAVIDSRLVEQDFLFFAIKGEKADGHDYIRAVHEKGALVSVCEHVPEGSEGACIVVENTVEALKKIAKFYREQLDIKVVGITGSVGKTTTKEFIASVLAQKFEVLKTEGNLNNQIGLPLTILKIRDNHKVAVVEMGINDFGEMKKLSEIAKPDICVITNIGECHLEKLGTRDGVLKAKTEIFEFMNPEGEVVLFGDDDKLATIKEVNGKKPITYGLENTNDVYPTKTLNRGLWGSECTIENGEGTFGVSIPLPGKHMILNTLAATAVAKLMEIPVTQIATGVANVKTLNGRTNIIQKNSITIIDDCYNANPVSMKAAIDMLKESVTPTVAILGDMFELGDNSEALHEEVGAYAADKQVNKIVCVGKMSKKMYDKAMVAASTNDKTEVMYFETIEETIEKLPEFISKDDAVLVKASNGMKFSQIVDALTSDELKEKLESRNENLFPKEDANTNPLLKNKSENEQTIEEVSEAAKKARENETATETDEKKKINADKEEQKSTIKQIGIIAGIVVLAAIIVVVSILVVKHKKYTDATDGIMVGMKQGEVITKGVLEDRVLAQSSDNVAFADSKENDFGMKYDGKYVYYCSYSDSMTPLVRVTDKGNNSTIVADGIVKYDILSKGKVLYYDGSNLYISTAKGKESETTLAAEKVKDYRLSEDSKAVLFLTTDKNLNYIELGKNDTLVTIDSAVNSIVGTNGKLDQVAYTKDDGLYCNTKLKESICVADSYREIYVPENEKEVKIYYYNDSNKLCYYKAGDKKAKEVVETNAPKILKNDDGLATFFYVPDSNNKNAVIVREDKTIEIKDFDAAQIAMTEFVKTEEKNGKMYFIDKTDTYTNLCSVSYEGLGKGKVVTEDNNVYSVEYVDDKNVFVLKGDGENKDLYRNGVLVAKNVQEGSFKPCEYGDGFVFAYHNMSGDGFYDICLYKDDVIENIGKSINLEYIPVSADMIYYSALEDGKSNVMCYRGKKSKTELKDTWTSIYIKKN